MFSYHLSIGILLVTVTIFIYLPAVYHRTLHRVHRSRWSIVRVCKILHRYLRSITTQNNYHVPQTYQTSSITMQTNVFINYSMHLALLIRSIFTDGNRLTLTVRYRPCRRQQWLTCSISRHNNNSFVLSSIATECLIICFSAKSNWYRFAKSRKARSSLATWWRINISGGKRRIVSRTIICSLRRLQYVDIEIVVNL